MATPKECPRMGFDRASEVKLERFLGPDRASPDPAAPQLAMPAVPPRPAPRCSAHSRCGAPTVIAATAAKAASRATGSSDSAGGTAGLPPSSPTSAPLPAGDPCDTSPPSVRVQSDPLFRLAGAGRRGTTAALAAERTVCRPVETSQRGVRACKSPACTTGTVSLVPLPPLPASAARTLECLGQFPFLW